MRDIILCALNTSDMPRCRAYRYTSSSATPKTLEYLDYARLEAVSRELARHSLTLIEVPGIEISQD